MNILYLTKYSSKGASSRLRQYQFHPHLRKLGHNIESQCLFDDEYIDYYYKFRKKSVIYTANGIIDRLMYIVKNINKFDLIWIQAEIIPYFPPIIEYYLKIRNIKFVVEYDDAIFHNYDKFKFYNSVFGNKIDKVMEYANHIVVGNRYLENRANKSSKENISVIPTVVDESRYKVDSTLSTKKIDGVKLKIGWIGTPNTQNSLELIKNICEDENLCKQIKFVLIGANKHPFYGVEVDIIPWSEDTEVQSLMDIDIGIMPLYDTDFEKGKCSYKLIQYMACGKPLLASPVGMNKDVVVSGVNGFLCDSTKEWIDAINKFVSSSELRSTCGNKARESMEKYYSLSSALKSVQQVLNGV
ncbi:hypothetical protein BCS95_15080 [Vibrio breoganii]|uniref:glycosyltransferase family 4 protein n=1 Tax=Vibrio breoganii TaxID=553239 RepID=UPI000CC878C3|nr:glycosyltransferase family 4 protein [Vibrio breoganii]PMP00968.1 hypothetical protein BCS95_15080 [Vibrio breoganii]